MFPRFVLRLVAGDSDPVRRLAGGALPPKCREPPAQPVPPGFATIGVLSDYVISEPAWRAAGRE